MTGRPKPARFERTTTPKLSSGIITTTEPAEPGWSTCFRLLKSRTCQPSPPPQNIFGYDILLLATAVIGILFRRANIASTVGDFKTRTLSYLPCPTYIAM